MEENVSIIQEHVQQVVPLKWSFRLRMLQKQYFLRFSGNNANFQNSFKQQFATCLTIFTMASSSWGYPTKTVLWHSHLYIYPELLQGVAQKTKRHFLDNVSFYSSAFLWYAFRRYRKEKVTLKGLLINTKLFKNTTKCRAHTIVCASGNTKII